MSWPVRKLEEICSFKTGKLDSNAAVPNGEFPFFTCAQQTYRINIPAFDTEAVLLGGNNAAGIYPLKYYKGQFNAYQRTYVIESLDELTLSIRFLYYSLQQALTHFQNVSIGAATQYLTKPILHNFCIPLPPVHTQNNIVKTLSAYDNLIENNRRRIFLLGESARLLYREWFIYLRFPGREHANVVDGVPEGWERKTLAELCESVDYGYTASAEQEEIGPKFLRITDIVPNVIDWISVPHCKIEDKRLSKFLLREGDIVIARTGATVGYAKRIHKRNPPAVFASYLVRLRLKPETNNLMIGVFVESDSFKAYVQSRVGGAAQPNANAKVLSGAEVLVPPQLLQRTFGEFVEPLIDQRETLVSQNQKLKQARDLLLPRLMSGEIAV